MLANVNPSLSLLSGLSHQVELKVTLYFVDISIMLDFCGDSVAVFMIIAVGVRYR